MPWKAYERWISSTMFNAPPLPLLPPLCEALLACDRPCAWHCCCGPDRFTHTSPKRVPLRIAMQGEMCVETQGEDAGSSAEFEEAAAVHEHCWCMGCC